MSDELYREPWDVDVTLVLPILLLDIAREPGDAQLPLIAASWMETESGWQLGGLLKSTADLSMVAQANVHYPDGFAETIDLTGAPARHCRTGDPRGTFTTLHIAGEPTWPGAKVQHEAMLQQMRDEGLSFIGDEEDD